MLENDFDCLQVDSIVDVINDMPSSCTFVTVVIRVMQGDNFSRLLFVLYINHVLDII